MADFFYNSDDATVHIIPDYDKIPIIGETVETGTGTKSPDNPYTLTGTTAWTVSNGGNQSQTIALPQPLYSLPNGTADNYDAVSGTGTSKIKKIVLDGSTDETWNFTAEYTSTARFDGRGVIPDSAPVNNIKICCDKFKVTGIDSSDTEHIRNSTLDYATTLVLYINKTRLSTLDSTGLREWLSANPLTVLYELATPQAISGECISFDLQSGEPFTMDSGTTYYVDVTPKEGIVLESVYYNDGLGQEIDLPINESGVASLNINGDYIPSECELYITVTTPIVTDVAGFTHLYKVDKNILNDVSKQRWGTQDLGQYIINLIEIPFPVTDLETREHEIQLGNTSLPTQAIELNNDRLVIDLGNITVTGKYHNVYDYLNTDIRLHLPFSDTIDLDVTYVMDGTISVKYILDLYTRNMTINVISDKINNIIETQTTNVGREIPFQTNNKMNVQGSITNVGGVDNGLLSAFIEVVRNNPIEQNSMFSDEVTEITTLQNMSGYVTVNNINLQTNATYDEQRQIKSILNSGVYIK